MALTSVEICTGAGGQALGLHNAGFTHRAVIEVDPHACGTLRLNKPEWNVLEMNLLDDWDASEYAGIDLLAGGVPCPPFSKAGRQLGADDERDLFPRALDLAEILQPKSVMLENVRGLLDPQFDGYRQGVNDRLRSLGYEPYWKLLNASDYGVPQLRPRVILVAIREGLREFQWPEPHEEPPQTVGQALEDLMGANGWEGLQDWVHTASAIAPTLVGGSKKHGGPDLGPTRARKAWLALGVDGRTIAEEPPERDFVGHPRLTVRMAARLQGFPDWWEFAGRKTAAYRQVGNAFPPPVAEAVGLQIKKAIRKPAKKSLASVA